MSTETELTEEEAEFAEQLTEERLRGQDWLKHAKKLQDDEIEEEEAEEEITKPEDPFDVKPKRKNWLANRQDPDEVKDIMKKRKRGRPKGSLNKVHNRDRAIKESIQVMTAAGLKPSIIARLLKMSLQKLKNKFPGELEYGDEILQTRMVNALVQKGLDGNVSALIFYLKSKAGWKEADKNDIQDADRVALSEVERTQRLMSILMGNPALLEKMKQKQQEAPIDVTPKPKEISVGSHSADDEDEEEEDEKDVFDL